MPGPDVLVSVPVALGGDALSGNNAAVAAIGVVSMGIGYAFLAGLWYFVFRRSPAEREAERALREARAEAVRQWRPATAENPATDGHAATEVTADVHTPPAGARGHGRPLQIDRRPGSRFRRR